jgi:hypothetical protein
MLAEFSFNGYYIEKGGYRNDGTTIQCIGPKMRLLQLSSDEQVGAVQISPKSGFREPAITILEA